MACSNRGDDILAIEAIIARQFESLTWAPGAAGDWDTFSADFATDARLYPAARPAKAQTVVAFVERMKQLAETGLRSFRETVLSTNVHVFGNVAVAVAACETLENALEANSGVEMLLLIKNDGAWQIVAQAWDTEAH